MYRLENDPDKPADAVGTSVVVEEIDINGNIQKVIKKTYQLLGGRTSTVTKISNI